MKKSILGVALFVFAMTIAGPASAVRGKPAEAGKGTQSKAAAVSDRAVQSKAGVQSNTATVSANKASAANAKSNAAK